MSQNNILLECRLSFCQQIHEILQRDELILIHEQLLECLVFPQKLCSALPF